MHWLFFFALYVLTALAYVFVTVGYLAWHFWLKRWLVASGASGGVNK